MWFKKTIHFIRQRYYRRNKDVNFIFQHMDLVRNGCSEIYRYVFYLRDEYLSKKNTRIGHIQF